MSWNQVFQIFSLIVCTLVHHRINGEPVWPENCSTYEMIEGNKYPYVGTLGSATVETLFDCRSLCTSNVHCGGFTFKATAGAHTGQCQQYLLNDEIITTHMNSNWYGTNNQLVFFTKTCPVYIDDRGCNTYRLEMMDVYLPVQHRMVSAGWYVRMTRDQCEMLCTLHDECRSVTYLHSRNLAQPRGLCFLYRTTIADVGRDLSDTSSWFSYTGTNEHHFSSTRYCSPGGSPMLLYDPTATTPSPPTTPPVVTTVAHTATTTIQLPHTNEAITLVACEGNNEVIISCEGSINIERVNYGRTNSTLCKGAYELGATELANSDCVSGIEVWNKVVSLCEGHFYCQLTPSSVVFGDTCPETYKYLEIKLKCTTD